MLFQEYKSLIKLKIHLFNINIIIIINNKNIELKGFLDDETTVQYYQNCRAFIFAGSDDFGIAPVEAMAAGKPVLALRDGGALETIIEGKTGEFFDAPIIELLVNIL